jgi:hypothetical protein
VPQPTSSLITAIQVIANGRSPYVRVNQAVRGVFWAMIRPDWIQIGWDLPADERDETSHITVLEGHIGGRQASLVFWNVNPSVIRAATNDQLLAMEDKSIGISGVRHHWRSRKSTIDPAEIRSALFLADKTGVHPAETGTFIAKYVLPRYGRELPEADLDASHGWLEAQPDSDARSPEEHLVRLEEVLKSSEMLANLRSVADQDELVLLDAWERAFLQSPTKPTLAGLAREQGWDAGTAQAVLKRLRRKLRK